MENKPEITDQDLRRYIVDRVLEYHKNNNADTKRLQTDLEMVYSFITKFIK
jgi:hypothetical protein